MFAIFFGGLITMVYYVWVCLKTVDTSQGATFAEAKLPEDLPGKCSAP